MSDPVELMGAGVRTGAFTAVIGSCDDLIVLTVGDGAGAGTITMPVYAFRHLMERGALKVAEVEEAIAAGPVEPLVLRRV